MLIYFLIAIAIVSILAAIAILVMQDRAIRKGEVVIDESYSGPEHVSATLHAVLRFLLRRSVYIRKFIMQYALHGVVRAMYYLDLWFSRLYAKSRNMFVKNAVRNRGTVPHFWNHLKVYKQEMDKEKQDEVE